MTNEQLINDLRGLAATMTVLGDLKKAETASKAATRLEEMETAKKKLMELLGVQSDTLEAYLEYEYRKSGKLCHG